MSEQYKGDQSQPEGVPMLSLPSAEIDKLVEEIEARRELARTQSREESEDPEASLQKVLREHRVFSNDVIAEINNRLLVRKIQQKVRKPRIVGDRGTKRGVHPRGWLGELEDRQP